MFRLLPGTLTEASALEVETAAEVMPLLRVLEEV
jgi:hypothetical protein